MDRSSSIRLYTQEVLNFLSGVVIKFEPFVSLFNTKAEYLSVAGFDADDPKTFPYYRVLAGDAAFATETLYGFSPVLRKEVLLNRDNIIANPDIAAFYRDAKNLKILLARYPNDQFLIRQIINPVVDIDAAIAAQNLTILPTEFEDTFLNQYERTSIMLFLQDILWRIDYRWYINTFEYEDLYPLAFWGMLWNVLPLIVLTKRIMNIKTAYVHPFHIWEYLTSLGFGSYKGYLTREQELFLYRNALYLKFNAGKAFLLKILEKIFLTPLAYSLASQSIISQTTGREQYHDKLPDVAPSTGSQEDYSSSTTFDSFLKLIYTEGLDDRNDATYLASVTDLFSKAPTNKLSTKFLEFERNLDVSEMMLLLRFILDSAVFLDQQQKLSFVVDVTSPITKNVIRFNTVTDTLCLLYYCIYKQLEGVPTKPFSKYTTTTAIVHTSKPTIPAYTFVDGEKILIKSYVDLENIVDAFPYATDNIYMAKDLSSILGEQYLWLFAMINKLKSVSSAQEHETHVAVYRTLVPELKVLDIRQNFEDYTTFFKAYPEALTEINKITTDDQYGEFIYAIISAICPLEYGFAKYVRDDLIVSVLIEKIKELFMYLVSYNINFINRVFEQNLTIDLPKIDADIITGVVGNGWWTPGWWEGNQDTEVPWIGTMFVGGAFILLSDMYNTFDYRVNIYETTQDTFELENEFELSCAIENTAITLTFQDKQPDSTIQYAAETMIYVVEVGAELVITTTSIQ